MSKIVSLRGLGDDSYVKCSTDALLRQQLALRGDEPSSGSLVAATLGWLAVGMACGAAFWVTGREAIKIFQGKA